MKSKALREQRAKLVQEARDLANGVPDGQAMSAEIEAKFDTLMAEADKLKGAIDKIERLEDSEAHLAQRIEHRAGRENVSTDEAEERGREENAAYMAWIRGGLGSLTEEHRAIAQRRLSPVQNAQGTTPDTAGGYTVPEGFYGRLEDAELAYGGMTDAGFVFDTATGNALPIPTDNDTSNKGAILGENVQTGTQDVSFGAVTLNAYTYTSKLVLVSNQLLQDSAFNLDTFLATKLGTRLARITNQHFTTGTGASQPTGITAAATLGVTAASATAIKWDETIDLLHSVDPAYRMNGRYMFADTVLQALKKMKDGQGRPLWQPGYLTKEPDTINGHPYTINQDMAAIATGNKSMLFGDFSKYYIRRVAGVQVLRLTERYADFNQTGFLAFQRWDGNLVDAGTHPVKYLAQA